MPIVKSDKVSDQARPAIGNRTSASAPPRGLYEIRIVPLYQLRTPREIANTNGTCLRWPRLSNQESAKRFPFRFSRVLIRLTNA